MNRVRIFLWVAACFISAHAVLGEARLRPGRPDDVSIFEENGKVGLKDGAGQVLIPASYDNLGWSNGQLSIVDEVVGYKAGGFWGLIHISNKRITAAEYLELLPGEGSLLVARCKPGLSQRPSYGLLNTAGKIVIPFLYDGLKPVNMRVIALSRAGSKFNFGLIDHSNKILIPLQYQRIYPLGSLRYAVEDFQHKTAIFSEEGKQVTGFVIDSISSYKKDCAVFYQHLRQGLIDRGGRVKLEPVYGEIRIDDDGTIRYRHPDTWHFLDGENKALRQYQADSIIAHAGQRYAVRMNGKFQLTDHLFKPVSGQYFSALDNFHDGKAVFRDGRYEGLMDETGRVLIAPLYEKILYDGPYLRARLATGYKNRWIVLDAMGNAITKKPYEDIGAFNGTFFPVRYRGYWGAIDGTGKEVVACVHDSLSHQVGRLIAVKFKGEYGVIDLAENWIVTPQPNKLEILNGQRYFEFSGATTFLKSFGGNTIYFSDNRLEFRSNYLLEHLPSGAFWIVDLAGIVTDRSYQPPLTEKIFQEREGLRAIQKDGKFGFIDAAGRLRIANRYEAVRPFSNGLAAIRIRGRWGFIDTDEKLVVQPVYDSVGRFINGRAIVSQGKQFGLIDAGGRVILPLRYDAIEPNAQQRFVLKQNGHYGLASETGALLINPKYTGLTDTPSGYVIVQRGEQFGLLTGEGVSTIPLIYDGLVFNPHQREFMALQRSAWEVYR